MIFIRLFGLWLFLLALIALAVDSTKSLAANEIIVTSFGEQWYELNQTSLKSFQIFIESYIHPFLWSSIIFNILTWPSWIVLSLMGMLIYWLGRKRQKTSIFIN